MRRETEPLLEAIRCELLAVRHRVETREAPREMAARPAAATGERVAPVPVVAGAADAPIPARAAGVSPVTAARARG